MWQPQDPCKLLHQVYSSSFDELPTYLIYPTVLRVISEIERVRMTWYSPFVSLNRDTTIDKVSSIKTVVQPFSSEFAILSVEDEILPPRSKQTLTGFPARVDSEKGGNRTLRTAN
jgi:hypothetical protein